MSPILSPKPCPGSSTFSLHQKWFGQNSNEIPARNSQTPPSSPHFPANMSLHLSPLYFICPFIAQPPHILRSFCKLSQSFFVATSMKIPASPPSLIEFSAFFFPELFKTLWIRVGPRTNPCKPHMQILDEGWYPGTTWSHCRGRGLLLENMEEAAGPVR